MTATTVLRSISAMHAFRRALGTGHRIGFIPTMGALHGGHANLVRTALKHCDVIIMSVYVNETQFGAEEDLDRYPRTLDSDIRLFEAMVAEHAVGLEGDNVAPPVVGVFAPPTSEMYPTGIPDPETSGTFVTVHGITNCLEGGIRPHFFRGVATIVTKLLNAVQPDVLYLGQKDVQQCVVIKRMVRDLLVPVEIKVEPTVREADGLAMSSRNRFLTSNERECAASVYQALSHARAQFDQGLRSVNAILRTVNADLSSGLPPDSDVQYVKLSDPLTLQELTEDITEGAILSLAVRLPESGTRLIDNELLGCAL